MVSPVAKFLVGYTTGWVAFLSIANIVLNKDSMYNRMKSKEMPLIIKT